VVEIIAAEDPSRRTWIAIYQSRRNSDYFIQLMNCFRSHLC